MKIEKNYGSACSYLGLLQLVFRVGYSVEVQPGKIALGIIRLGLKQKTDRWEKSNQRILLCPKTSMIPDQSYLKPHTIAEVAGRRKNIRIRK